MPPRPTTSTYALLGLLAEQPWGAYDLAQQATRSMRYAHPRTESHLYEEVKRVERLGWATAQVEYSGRRSRTVYEITAEGREALQGWLATPPREPQLEFEALLRVLFADQTDKATLDSCLEHAADNARRVLDDGIELLRPYAANDAPYPERAHIIALLAAFVSDYLLLIERWSEFARDEISRWPRTEGLGLTDRTADILNRVIDGTSAVPSDQGR